MSKFEKKIKIYADGGNKEALLKLNKDPLVSGTTTNPTLLFKSGITDYKAFALDLLQEIKDKPISFEVFSDDFVDMKRQALEIASWGCNVYVKIPITNTLGKSSIPLIEDLSHNGVKVNITAVFTMKQIKASINSLAAGTDGIVSIFCGRIGDTLVDPAPIVKKAVKLAKPFPNIEILWASTRTIFNIYEAQKAGAHIITVPTEMLSKMSSVGKDLKQFSLETVAMFRLDALAGGFTL